MVKDEVRAAETERLPPGVGVVEWLGHRPTDPHLPTPVGNPAVNSPIFADETDPLARPSDR